MSNTSSDTRASPAPQVASAAPKEAAGRIEAPRPKSATFTQLCIATVEALRPYQWLKSLLVFAPLAAAHRLAEIGLVAAAARAAVAFSLCASATYILNDLRDLAADRLHPHKRYRPIASGRLPVPVAIAVLPLLLGAAAALARPLGAGLLAVLALYLVSMSLYTLRIKSVVLLDAFMLAGGYALRVFAGGVAVGIQPSPHLLAFCIFMFFSLALIKRYAELALLRPAEGLALPARPYRLQDEEFIMALGSSCGVLSVLVLALYLSTGHAHELHRHYELIWLTCVLLLYWISHMWLTAHRGRMTDDPLVFAVKDPVSATLIVLMGVTAWLAA